METPLFSPENLTGIGAFLFVVLLNAVGFMNGRLFSRRAVEDMRQGYEARIAQEHEIREMFRKAYEREVAAKELRWNGVGQMVLESTKTVAHALESIQDEAKNARTEVHE